MQELHGTENEPDFLPVVKLFMPEYGFVWLSLNSIRNSRISPSACAISGWAVLSSVPSAFRKSN